MIRNLMLGAAVVMMAAPAMAQQTKLRIQTHFSQETLSGQMAEKYIDDITAMSNGEIEVEMFYSSSAVVKSVETFDAAATGILDCDMTGGAYQTGKNPAFQFVRRHHGRLRHALSAALLAATTAAACEAAQNGLYNGL